MSKKIRYSQPLAIIWDAYQDTVRKNKLKISSTQFVQEWIKQKTHNPFLSDAAANKVQAEIFAAEMFYLDAEKQFLHLYFIDKSLRDFLMSLSLADFKGLTDFIIENGQEDEDGIVSTQGDLIKIGKKSTSYNFGIHIPYENKYRGYAFNFTYKPQENKLVFAWLIDKDCGFISKDDFLRLEKNNDERSKTIISYFKLAVNTIAYMNAFPECIKDGVPEEINKEYSKIISIAEKVLDIKENEKSEKVVAPHFRRGYFKRLTSDFYTHKKGQIVFVKETMVNGKAKTVYTANNLEELFD